MSWHISSHKILYNFSNNVSQIFNTSRNNTVFDYYTRNNINES